jgi:glycerol uptake facilitator protein
VSNSDIIIGENFGTAVLILLGAGVCAAVTLKKSKAQNAGWVAIAFGWGFAVLTAAYLSAGVSGAHLNPAVTLGLAVEGATPWDQVPVYIVSQMVGAIIGAILAWATYHGQFQVHMADIANQPDAVEGAKDAKAGPVLGIFSTGPEIRNAPQNLVTEIIATFVLVIAILTQGLNDAGNGLGTLGVLITSLVVVSIGLSLGGPTGYAINPARDLGPRIAHAILPIKGKGRSDWGYSWIPVIGPVVGGIAAGLVFNVAFA